MESTEQIVAPIPASKQDRILIWRDEVATANLDQDDSASSPSRTGPGSSATSTTTSSSSSRSALVVAHGRRLLSRLAGKLSRRSSASPTGGRFWRAHNRHPGDSPHGPTRTAMYASLSPDNAAASWAAAEEAAGDAVPGLDPSTDGDAALRLKQERLMRAAKLLEQGRPGPE